MSDTIAELGKSIIQHGKVSDRIYLMKLDPDEAEKIVVELEEIAKQNQYTKIFAKIPSKSKQIFLDSGYIQEAHIPYFYNGEDDAFFMAKFFSDQRRNQQDKDRIVDVLKVAQSKQTIRQIDPLKQGYECRKAIPEDALQMSQVYKKVFASYPFPIHNPEYIKETMHKHIEYYGIWHEGKIAALSSSEMDLKSLNVEMTDFATLPEYRGNKFAIYLLNEMEQAMKQKGIKTAYTIARAVSYGMNSTFSKMGYTFTGTLVNNTNISGGLESMNVWYKPL